MQDAEVPDAAVQDAAVQDAAVQGGQCSAIAQLSSGAIVSYALGSASRVLSRDSTSSPPECGSTEGGRPLPSASSLTRPTVRGRGRRSGSARPAAATLNRKAPTSKWESR